MSVYRSTDSVKNAGWKYGQNKSNSVLIHSDTYLGEDYSDGIKHYKYIKKEKKNGKMRYYYHDTDLEDADRIAKEAYDDYAKEQNKLLKGPKYTSRHNFIDYKVGSDYYVNDKIRDAEILEDRSKEASRQRDKIYFKKIPSRIIGNGKAFLMNLFDKILG